MTTTEAAITRLTEMTVTNPRFLHPVICDDVRALLAQRDRYEKVLQTVAAVTNPNGPDKASAQHMADTAHRIAQEALRCQ